MLSFFFFFFEGATQNLIAQYQGCHYYCAKVSFIYLYVASKDPDLLEQYLSRLSEGLGMAQHGVQCLRLSG